jgi:VWFA-related protein
VRKLLVFTLTAAAWAQAPIQITTRLVQVAVVVRDKHGAVADLTKGDFEVLDKGKSRQITTFSVARASERIPRTSLSPNTFSNRLDRQSESPVAATVLLFDSLNTPFKDQGDARRQVLTFLKALDPETPVAIYALGNNLRIVHDFTQDQASLTRALERYRSSTSTQLANSQPEPTADILTTPTLPGLTTNDLPDNADLVAQILQPLQDYSVDRRVAITLSAMNAIANRMAGVPGRKNLIWISGAFPLSLGFDRSGLSGAGQRLGTYAGPMKDAAMAIDQANVAIYPVDARGLLVQNAVRTEMPALRNQTGLGQASNMPTPEEMAGNREIETMQLLADWTGGKAFYNSNDIRGAVKQATEDAEVTYTLGFYAEERDLDGSYHDLKVKVARKGTDTRYRKGYFAAPLTAVDSPPAGEILKNALFSPADATALGLTASLTPDAAHAGSFILALGMDMQNLSLAAKNNRWADMLNFVIAQQAPTGVVLDAVRNSIKIDVTDENRDKLLKEGLSLKVAITPAPGSSQIRVAVMDQATGNVGSLRIVPPAKP